MLWIFNALIVIASAAPNKLQGKLSCNAKELSRLDCRLTVDTYNLRLLNDTVAWNDGTWHTVDDMPLKGEGVTWEKARFEFINGWPILQLWIWDAGTGENKVQSLHWIVADAEKRHFTVIARGIVRKRHPAENGKFLTDAMEPHNLKPLKDGSLEWTLKTDKKIFGRTKNGV